MLLREITDSSIGSVRRSGVVLLFLSIFANAFRPSISIGDVGLVSVSEGTIAVEFLAGVAILLQTYFVVRVFSLHSVRVAEIPENFKRAREGMDSIRISVEAAVISLKTSIEGVQGLLPDSGLDSLRRELEQLHSAIEVQRKLIETANANFTDYSYIYERRFERLKSFTDDLISEVGENWRNGREPALELTRMFGDETRLPYSAEQYLAEANTAQERCARVSNDLARGMIMLDTKVLQDMNQAFQAFERITQEFSTTAIEVNELDTSGLRNV